VNLGEALTIAVVEENPVLQAGPQGIIADLAWSLDLKEQAAGLVGASDQALKKGRLLRIELIVGTKPLQDMLAKLFECGQGNNWSFHE